MNQMVRAKAILSAGLAVLASYLGILFVPVVLMVLCNITDYATGLMASAYRGDTISSYKSMKGIIKKLGMWIMVEVGWIMDLIVDYTIQTFGWNFHWSTCIACLVAVWIVVNELISIKENVKAMGTNVPAFVDKITDGMLDAVDKELLEIVRKEKEEKDE